MAADTQPGPPAPGCHGTGGDGRGGPRPHGGIAVTTADDGTTTVRFWGAVDLAVRASGTGTLGGLREQTRPMTVDCRDVTFMDSTGLSVLVRLVRDAAADGRPVTFLGAAEQVRDLLRTTGVDLWMVRLGVRGVPTED